MAQAQQGPQTIDAAAAPLLEALQKIAGRRQVLQIKPFRGYSQDPDGWIVEYERAATGLGWDADMCLEAVPFYLKDAALTWFQNLPQNQLLRWDVDAAHQQRNQAFKTALIDQFRTPANERQWHLELDRRSQQKDETVEQYAAGFATLLRKVDPRRRIPEGTRIHMFLRGLQPTLQYHMTNYLTCTDNLTFQGVITAAQNYEQSQVSHIQALASHATQPGVAHAATAVTQEDPMAELAKQIAKLLQPMNTAITQLTQQMNEMRTQQVRPPPQQYQQQQAAPQLQPQWRQRQPRGTLTCHRCGQFGHIARICPNQLAPQAPPQPVNITRPLPTLAATAQEVYPQPHMSAHTYVPTPPMNTQPPVPQQRTAKAVPLAPPGQMPRPDSVHYCAPSEQDGQHLNF